MGQLQFPRQRAGNMMVSVLIGFALLGVLFMAMSSSLRYLGSAGRGIEANADLGQIDVMFRLLTESENSCARSGLIGMDISTAAASTPVPIDVTLRLPVASGVGDPVLAAGEQMGTRRIDRFQLMSAVNVDGTASSPIYFAKFELETSVVGQAMTAKNPKRDYYLKLVTNAAGVVQRCYSAMRPGIPEQVALLRLSSNTSAISQTGTTIDSWTEIRDDLGVFDPGAPSRITITSGVHRVILKAATIWSDCDTGRRVLRINKNGAPLSPGVTSAIWPTASTAYQHLTSPILDVNPGDYFQLVAEQNGTTACVPPYIRSTIDTWFSLEVVE